MGYLDKFSDSELKNANLILGVIGFGTSIVGLVVSGPIAAGGVITVSMLSGWGQVAVTELLRSRSGTPVDLDNSDYKFYILNQAINIPPAVISTIGPIIKAAPGVKLSASTLQLLEGVGAYLGLKLGPLGIGLNAVDVFNATESSGQVPDYARITGVNLANSGWYNGIDSTALVTINDTPQGTARITGVWADGVEYSLEDSDGNVNIPDKVKNLTTSDYKITENNSYDPTKPDAQNQQAVTEQVNNNIIRSQGGVTVTVNDPNKLSSSLLKDALAMAITTDYDRVGNGNIVDTYVLSDWANKELSITTPIVMQAVALNTSENVQRTYVDPLVLDLNGDGVKLTDYDSSPVLFDSDNDDMVNASDTAN